MLVKGKGRGRKKRNDSGMSCRRRNLDLTKCGVWRTLFILSWPIVLGMALQTSFNIVDAIFVGMLGAEGLAAISLNFPVVFIFIALASGLSIGSTALISHSIGSGDSTAACNIAEHSILISLLVAASVTVLGLYFSPALYTFMGASGSLLETTIQYSNIIFIGFIFLFLGFLSQGIIQAGGDTITPTRNLFIATVLNIILDPLMIFGFGPVPAMGLAGAAIATVLSRGVGAFFNIMHVFTGRAAVNIRLRYFRPDMGIIRRILEIAIPSSLSQSINSIGLILMTGLAGAFGVSAIAAFGVGVRLESIAILPIIGLSSAVIPFVGQNLGAGRPERAQKVTYAASLIVVVFMILISVIWLFAPYVVYSPFTSDSDILAIGAGYFRIIAFGYVFLGLNFILGSAFQGAGKTMMQMFINCMRWVLIVAISYTLTASMGITGVWIGFPVGNFIGFAAGFAFFRSGAWLRSPKPEGHMDADERYLKTLENQ